MGVEEGSKGCEVSMGETPSTSYLVKDGKQIYDWTARK